LPKDENALCLRDNRWVFIFSIKPGKFNYILFCLFLGFFLYFTFSLIFVHNRFRVEPSLFVVGYKRSKLVRTTDVLLWKKENQKKKCLNINGQKYVTYVS
jgi:hypothetical protein